MTYSSEQRAVVSRLEELGYDVTSDQTSLHISLTRPDGVTYKCEYKLSDISSLVLWSVNQIIAMMNHEVRNEMKENKIDTITKELTKMNYLVTNVHNQFLKVELISNTGHNFGLSLSFEEIESMVADAVPLIVSRINENIKRYI